MTTKFINWIKENHKNLDLRINDLNWIKDYFPNYYDVVASITVNDIKFIGRGFSEISRDVADTKAITESIERALAKTITESESDNDRTADSTPKKSWTSSGFALHPDENAAILGASLELIERDLFLCHYLTNTPFCDVSTNSITEGTLYNSIKDRFADDGIEIKLGELFSSSYFSCYICVCFGDKSQSKDPFGVIIGLGCEKDPIQAINKAVLEAMPNLVGHLKGHHIQLLNLKEFLALPSIAPLDHLALSKSVDNSQYMRSLFSGKKRDTDNKKQLELLFADMKVKELELPRWCHDCDLAAMRAYNPALQGLYFGPTTKEKVNFDRLASFCGRKISYKDIHLYPHPLP